MKTEPMGPITPMAQSKTLFVKIQTVTDALTAEGWLKWCGMEILNLLQYSRDTSRKK